MPAAALKSLVPKVVAGPVPMRWLHGGGAALALFAQFSAGATTGPPAVASTVRPPGELRLRAGPGTRLLVFAPHPDDEAIGAGGLMQRVRATGGSVRIALLTSGDGFPEGLTAIGRGRRLRPRDFREYGDLREREATTAAQVIGIDRTHLWFLGFPDEGLCQLAAGRHSEPVGFESPYTRRRSPAEPEQVIRGVTYRGIDVDRELESLLTAYHPHLVAVADCGDDHPDHCATAAFVRDALRRVSARIQTFVPRVLQYLVHHDDWPNFEETRDVLLAPPRDLQADTGRWWSLTLTPHERTAKRRMLDSYRSQMAVMGGLLDSFDRPNELFFEGTRAPLPECWCADGRDASPPAPERTGPRATGSRR